MRSRASGFTLIELMVVVVIVAILAAIALPSYQNSVRKTRRADAKTALTSMAQTLERCLTQFGSYSSANCSITSPYDSDHGYYSVAVTRAATTFSLTATAQGAQANDTQCASFTLDHLGAQTATSSNCW
ncbi:prepilin-type N-terminal cleavage/methylation domain-containing protein [Sinimarinibacterium sp. CAU 1509]|uniref:type IV pilin protein n=1 Tax=Sinimarinibacterium sp. CAU 1509 TaxID=2562283 RepID=UPI0010AB773F|nr:type IV pilin protein [Sinimarinibacterium sp. CAU 1509]TJY62301.1 prepilin-type N-terminal cleavage/methylation domain-containing protein [Sinimarinibacterium sp. CAU 1509]